MVRYLIIARSVTHAQRIQSALSRVGIRAQIYHAPLDLNGGRGCAYAVEIRESDLSGAKIMIHRVGLDPVQIFRMEDGNYQEVQG